MVDTKMDFQEWWAQRGHCMWRDDKALASHVAKAAWDAATLAERERCAKMAGVAANAPGGLRVTGEELYNGVHGNHPTIHCNRFPAWSELTQAQRDRWDRKAAAAPPGCMGCADAICDECEP